MKRSPGSPTYGGGPTKRFESMRSSPQMQLQQQLHQQLQQQMHHQQQHHSQHQQNLQQQHQQQQHQQQHHQQHHQQHQHQQHQQHQQQQQQYQHNAAVVAAMAANQSYFPNLSAPPPSMQDMLSFPSPNSVPTVYPSPNSVTTVFPNPAPNPFLYNPTAAAVGLQARMWKYTMPPSPATPPMGYDAHQPPLPLSPPQQPPPLPPPEQEPAGFAAASAVANTTFMPIGVNVPSAATAAQEYDDVYLVNNKKLKRKSMSHRAGCQKQWDRDDALKAIALEKEYTKKVKSKILLLRFPDPELSREIVSKYSPQIESVHFQQNAAPRFCFVHLKEDADTDKVIENLSQIPFGSGFIHAELKRTQVLDPPPDIDPKEIDPYTLYIGNLPTTISSHTVKEHFPGAHRIDIGHALRMKFTRYAFVRYLTVEDSMEGFRQTVNTLIQSRSPIVRFRRFPLPAGEQRSSRKEPTVAMPPEEAENQDEATSRSCAEQEENAVSEKRATNETSPVTKPVPAVSTFGTESTQSSKPSQDIIMPSSSAFDSPNSLEEPSEQVIPDSKARVLIDAEQLSRSMHAAQPNNPPQRRSSIEEIFEALEQRQNQLKISAASAKLDNAPDIKKETDDLDDELSEEEEPINLLGVRYKDGESQVKPEPELCPSPTEPNTHKDMYHEDFEFEEEFEMEPDERDEADWPGPLTTESQASQTVDKSSSTIAAPSWEAIRKVELEEVEDKPAVEQPSKLSKSSSCLPFPFPAHQSEIEKLYEQQRRFKEREKGKRPRDDLDDMFARMNSDSEEDDFFC